MRVVVFTAIFGESDSLKPAPQGADVCLCFTDGHRDKAADLGWELVGSGKVDYPRRTAWEIRCLAEKWLGNYDRCVWIDASFTLTDLPLLLKDSEGASISALRHQARRSCYEEARCLAKIGQSNVLDVERQINAYKHVGYNPAHLSISCIIVRDRSPETKRFNETWDEQIHRFRGDNTQVSLDYSAWVHGLEIRALQGTRHDNPYSTHDHADHKRRRRPYEQ